MSHDVLTCRLCRNVTGCVHVLSAARTAVAPEESAPVVDSSSTGQSQLSPKETESDDSLEGDHGIEMEGIANLIKEHE